MRELYGRHFGQVTHPVRPVEDRPDEVARQADQHAGSVGSCGELHALPRETPKMPPGLMTSIGSAAGSASVTANSCTWPRYTAQISSVAGAVESTTIRPVGISSTVELAASSPSSSDVSDRNGAWRERN